MANTAKAQAIFKGMTPEQQQAFLNKQKTASAGDQAKVSAALKPIKPVVSTPAATTPGAPMTTVPPSNTPPINTPPVEPVQDNTVGPADPVTPQIDKAKAAWMKMNADQQQEFATKHNFDPKKYGLEFAKGSAKPQQPIGQNNQTTPPAATTPEAPAPVESTQPNYQDNSTARLQEIRNNLDQQVQQAPSLFNDRMAFDANFNYSLRSKEQKAVLDNFWYQKSQSDVFNNTPTDMLASQIATGQTSIDTFSFMKDKDPVKYAALQGAVTEANKKESLKASLDPATFMKEFTDRHDAAIKKIDEQESTINTAELIPAITKGKEELAVLKSEIDQIELDKAKIKDEVLAEYEGKGISKGLLNEIVADRQQTLIDQGNSKILQYNSKLGAVNANMDQMKMYNDLETQRTALAQTDFTNRLNLVTTLHTLNAADKSQTVTNPMSGLSYEKQSDGTWKLIDLPEYSPEGDTSASASAGISNNITFNSGGNGTARTDRHNNPAAFTTDIAKQAGLVEGVDYIKGDAFPNNKNLFTAKLLGDPLEITRRVIDKIGFKTQGGASRWSYTDALGLSNDSWANMDESQKNQAILKMYQRETRGGSLFSSPTSAEINDQVDLSNQSVNFNGTPVGINVLKQQYNKDKYSVFTPDQVTRFKAYDAKPDVKLLGNTAKEQYENGKQYALYKQIDTMDADEYGRVYIALSALPVQLRNNVNELEMAVQMIRQNLANGKTPQEAADIFRGFDVVKPEDRGLAMQLRYMMTPLGDGAMNLQELSRMINAGPSGKAQAVKNVEQLILKNAGTEEGKNYATLEGTVAADLKSIQTALSPDKIGQASGLGGGFGSLTRTLFGSSSGRKIVVSTINRLMKSYGYDESDYADGSDSYSSLNEKLQSIQDFMLSKLNESRAALNLPRLPDISYTDPAKRAQLYNDMNGGSSTTFPVSPLDFFNQVISGQQGVQ